MTIQPIIKQTKSFKLILNEEEKSKRKAMINSIVSQVVARYSEFGDVNTIDMKELVKQTTKKYDAAIRKKIIQSL